MIAHVYNVDVRDLLPRVSVPILVVHCRNNRAIRPIFVVAPNLISADKTNRKWAESAVRSVLRCHQLCEIGRVGAYFDHLSLNCKQRRTRWRSGGIRKPGAARVYLGGIRPEFGALFGPNKSIDAGEKLFARGSALLRISPVPFVRQADARNPVTSNTRRGFGVRISPPRRAVGKSEPCRTPA